MLIKKGEKMDKKKLKAFIENLQAMSLELEEEENVKKSALSPETNALQTAAGYADGTQPDEELPKGNPYIVVKKDGEVIDEDDIIFDGESLTFEIKYADYLKSVGASLEDQKSCCLELTGKRKKFCGFYKVYGLDGTLIGEFRDNGTNIYSIPLSTIYLLTGSASFTIIGDIKWTMQEIFVLSRSRFKLDDDFWGEFKDRNLKSLALSDKAETLLDLNDGSATTAITVLNAEEFSIPLSIVNYFKSGTNCAGFGSGWRSNLNRQLKVAKEDTVRKTIYTYIDEFGVSHTFEETYYYLSGNNPIEVPKDYVTIGLNGELTYNGKSVKKRQSCKGFELIPEINDFKHAGFIEQRTEERIQLEEFVNSYANTLKNYVKVNVSTGNVVARMDELTENNYRTLINGTDGSDYALMAETEAMQLRSLIYQLEQTELQVEQFELQKRQLNLQIKQTDIAFNEANNSIQYYRNKYDERNPDGSVKIDPTAPELNDPNKKEEKLERILDYSGYYSATNRLQFNHESLAASVDQKNLSERQDLTVQVDLIRKQVAYLKKQAADNLKSVKDAFTKYFAKKAELDLIVLHTPVRYLKDGDGIIHGFNEEGYLVCMFDMHGNSVLVEYDADKLISGLQDNNGKSIKFDYVDGKLSKITDYLERIVLYGYGVEDAIINCYNEELFIITYSNSEISSMSHGSKDFNYVYDSLNRLKSITRRVSPYLISESGTTIYERDKYENLLKAEYGDKTIKLIYPENEYEEYVFYKTGRIYTLLQADNTGVQTQFKYAYEMVSNQRNCEIFKSDNLGGTEEITEIYDFAYRLISKSKTATSALDNKDRQTTESYSYNEDGKLICFEKIDLLGSSYLVNETTNYKYDAQGKLILTEYYSGNDIRGKKIYEKFIYDEQGNLAKTVRWNSLDSSTKFYTESEVYEKGKVVVEKDETGEICREYEYEYGNNTVNGITYANGGKLSYGRNAYNNEITAVTQSTADGEANTTNIVYNLHMPVQFKSGDTKISLTYDYLGRKRKISVNDTVQQEISYTNYTFDEATGNCVYGTQLVTVHADENQSFNFKLEKTGTKTESGVMEITETLSVDNAELLRKNYNVYGKLTSVTDSVNNSVKYYSYNNGKLIRVETSINSKRSQNEYLTYSSLEQVITKSVGSLYFSHIYSFEYDDKANRLLKSIAVKNVTINPQYDVNGRNIGKIVNLADGVKYEDKISYVKVGDHATSRPSTIRYGNGKSIKDSIKYSYDKCGNIKTITENGERVATYAYDALNRLVREDNKRLLKTFVYTYDACGNIINRSEYGYTLCATESLHEKECLRINYEYSCDRLTAYNGEICEYNYLGSPTTYRNKPMDWQYGKQLVNFDGVTFAYDGEGRRINKQDISYVYDSDGRLVWQSNGLEFIYDHTGVTGLIYNEKPYIYRKDVQGNIIAILDNSGLEVVRYNYDAWGNHSVEVKDETCAQLAELNPFRYRSYYYDVETKLYYLQTRYYDPEVGRFISQDGVEYAEPETINGINLYAYCGNNPVTYVDPTGELFFTCLFISLAIGAVVGAAVNGVIAYNNGARGWEVVGAIAAGAVVGGAMGALAGAIIGAGAVIISTGIAAIGGGIGAGALVGGGIVGGSAVAVGAGTIVVGGGLIATGVLGGILGLNIVLSTTNNRGGYWGQKYSDDHNPEHIHLKGTDGTNIRIGKDGKPLRGEPSLKPQQKKALKRLWKEILELFNRV
jgi:RHS repeat-associated protein